MSLIIDHSALSVTPHVYDTSLHTYSGFPVTVVIPDITVTPKDSRKCEFILETPGIGS